MKRAEVLENILVLSLAPIVCYLIWGGIYWLWLALTIGLIGLFWPTAAKYLAQAWQQLAHFLGRINGTILLSIVFLLLVWPLGWLARFFRSRNSLQLKHRSDTYFQSRNHTFTADDLRDPW